MMVQNEEINMAVRIGQKSSLPAFSCGFLTFPKEIKGNARKPQENQGNRRKHKETAGMAKEIVGNCRKHQEIFL
jgi:hypothetical protein